jgi:ApbE superfamily uncharacterized protein (UPF0280 family)
MNLSRDSRTRGEAGMAQAVSTITRRSAIARLALTAVPMAVLAGKDSVYAQSKQTMPEKSPYERLIAPRSARGRLFG